MEQNNYTCLRKYLLDECIAMVKYLAAEGSSIPTQAKCLIEPSLEKGKQNKIDYNEILSLHRVLSSAVAPARPKTIWLLYKESQKNHIMAFLGPVSLVRRLMLTALLSLIAFIGISLSPHVNAASVAKGILEDHGMDLFLNLMFFLSAAALGACFSNLFEANRYIVRGVYDPKYESSYWIRLVLGLIAGLMLAVLIPVSVETPANSGISFISVPLLAMLGGFSAALVYRILKRAVNTVESLITGHPDKYSKLSANGQVKKQQQRLALEKKQILDSLMSLKNESNEAKFKDKLSNTINQILMS